MREAIVTELWWLEVVEAVGEDLPAIDIDSTSEDELVTKERVLVTTPVVAGAPLTTEMLVSTSVTETKSCANGSVHVQKIILKPEENPGAFPKADLLQKWLQSGEKNGFELSEHSRRQEKEGGHIATAATKRFRFGRGR